jgi:hypothetical protein
MTLEQTAGLPGFASSAEGNVGTAEEFRNNAQRCLRLAKGAYTRATQWHWLDVAQYWLGLARYAEEREQSADAGSSRGSERSGIGTRSGTPTRGGN